MQPKTLFRLMLRVIGVVVLIGGLPPILRICLSLSLNSLFVPTGNTYYYYGIMQLPGPILQAAFGIYLLRGPRWIVNLAVKNNLPHCYECGYSLQGLPASGKCPECGDAVLPGESDTGDRCASGAGSGRQRVTGTKAYPWRELQACIPGVENSKSPGFEARRVLRR